MSTPEYVTISGRGFGKTHAIHIAAIKSRLETATRTDQWVAEPRPSIFDPEGEKARVTDADVTSCPPENAPLIASAPADLTFLLEQLEATQARAAAAEARLARALERELAQGKSAVHHRDQKDDLLHAVIRVIESGDLDKDKLLAAGDFDARFPETVEHRRINDEAAARARHEDDDVPACSRCGKEDATYAGGLCYFCASEDSFGAE